MPHNTDLVAAIGAIQNIPGAAPPPPPPAVPASPAPVHDPFTSDQPFDHGRCTGATAFEAVSTALDFSWDETPETFPSFITFQIHSSEACWDAPASHGILIITGMNILTNYHCITEAEVDHAHINYTYPCAILIHFNDIQLTEKYP